MLFLVPVSLKEANAFVAEYHRHHKPTRGHKFSIGCASEGRLVGVAIVGRPVSRYLDDGLTLEVSGAGVCFLSAILEERAPEKYSLSPKACAGILRRAERRGKDLPPLLKAALTQQAGMVIRM